MTRKESIGYSHKPQIGWSNRLWAGKGASGIHINGVVQQVMTRKGSMGYSNDTQIGWSNRLWAGKGASGIHMDLKLGGPTGYEVEKEHRVFIRTSNSDFSGRIELVIRSGPVVEVWWALSTLRCCVLVDKPQQEARSDGRTEHGPKTFGHHCRGIHALSIKYSIRNIVRF